MRVSKGGARKMENGKWKKENKRLGRKLPTYLLLIWISSWAGSNREVKISEWLENPLKEAVCYIEVLTIPLLQPELSRRR